MSPTNTRRELDLSAVSVEDNPIGNIENISAIFLENSAGPKSEMGVYDWVLGNIKCYPRMLYFVAKLDEEVIGYILWQERGGFKEKAVFELEQVAVEREFQTEDMELEAKLIQDSLRKIKTILRARDSQLEKVVVITQVNEVAEEFYQESIGKMAQRCEKSIIRSVSNGDKTMLVFHSFNGSI